jgi:hypothetical protein
MKIENMTSGRGNKIVNQFILTEEGCGALGNFISRRVFQSYNTIIARITRWPDETRIELDADNWDYSVTTGKYRNLFLGETKKQTEKKIASGDYILANLNGGQ